LQRRKVKDEELTGSEQSTIIDDENKIQVTVHNPKKVRKAFEGEIYIDKAPNNLSRLQSDPDQTGRRYAWMYGGLLPKIGEKWETEGQARDKLALKKEWQATLKYLGQNSDE
jgi:hypothetical protein